MLFLSLSERSQSAQNTMGKFENSFILKDKSNCHFWLIEEEKVPPQSSIHQRVNEAYSPADDVILVASPIRSRLPAPLPSQLIALLRTCSFSGGPGTLVPGACATSFLCQDTHRSCGQQSPLHGLGLRGCFFLTSAQGQLLFFELVANPRFRGLGLLEAWFSI